MFTGKLIYDNNDYIFVLDEDIKELKLIPLKDKRMIRGLCFHLSSIMKEPYLVGLINENYKKMVAIPEVGEQIKIINDVLYISLMAYMIIDWDDSNGISKMTFYSPEIDNIFNINRAFNINIENLVDAEKIGIINVSTNDFDSTISQKQYFKINEKKICMNFDIKRIISTKIGHPPLSLKACLNFEFETTVDYSFIINLWYCAKNFICYLCFRKDIYFSSVELYSSSGKYTYIGDLNVNDNKKSEQKFNNYNRCIKYEYIKGNEGKILSDIANNTLYLRHFPKTYEDSKHIDIGSFVMTTAAFEREFSRNYPNGILKSPATIKIEEDVSRQIQILLDNSKGKTKEKYKFLLRLVKSDSLQSEIIQVGKDYSEIINIFGEYLYKLNNLKLKYNEICNRLATQRNRFAHGDLDKEFIEDSLLDIIFLRYIIYTLQLKSYGLSDRNIKMAIKDLFNINVMI